jgi:uroporphyrinogen-III synthase
MRVLVLRSQSSAAETAADLHARGHEPIVAPLMWIEIIARANLSAGPWAAFLLTSIHALRGLANQIDREEVRRVPVFTVGGRTAQQISQRGFPSVTSADGNVDDLADLVAARLTPPARLLYLAGEDRSGDLAGKLSAKGFAVDTIIVYRAVVAENMPPPALDALASGVDAVLHYSRRSAQAYVNAARRSGVLAQALAPAHLCLSAQVGEPLAGAGATSIKVADRPNQAALLGLIDPTTH